MPKIKPLYIPPPNGVRELFRRYQTALGLSSEELGKKLHMSGASVRDRYKRGYWSNADIRAWCAALGITDCAEIGEAVLYGRVKEGQI